ncbi:putative transcription factor C3H family [Helianthus annuus]|nr:putative transcription factor C3H family [Helianthus annuus]
MKPVMQSARVDPKSILCEFFKVGQCAKGFKCKFSHDLNVQRKGEKSDIFSDKRDEGTMDDWDLETLEKVVKSKGKEYNKINQPTSFVNTCSMQWRKSNMVGSGYVQTVIKSAITDTLSLPDTS